MTHERGMKDYITDVVSLNAHKASCPSVDEIVNPGSCRQPSSKPTFSAVSAISASFAFHKDVRFSPSHFYIDAPFARQGTWCGAASAAALR